MRLKIFGTWLLLMFISQLVTCEVMFAVFKVETKWPGGFEGSVTFPAVKKFPYGWIIYILFDSAVTDLKFFEGYLAGSHLNGRLYVILPLDHNKVLHIDALGKRSLRLQAKVSS